MALIFCKLRKQKEIRNWIFHKLKNLKKEFTTSCSKIARKLIFLRGKKSWKTFPTFLLSTYRHENLQNIFCLQEEKNILLSTYWHKKMMNFTEIWDPVFDSHGTLEVGTVWSSSVSTWIMTAAEKFSYKDLNVFPFKCFLCELWIPFL